MRDIIGIVYSVSFLGRLSGSIGIDYPMTEIVNSKIELSLEDIKLKLYEKHEHISNVKILNRGFIKGKRY